jgi:hypothetical protein
MPIIVNMEKALEIKKNMIRAERQPLLAALDIEMMRAIESANTVKQAEISAKKQALRDATTDPVVLNATTPEQLKAATPAALIS